MRSMFGRRAPVIEPEAPLVSRPVPLRVLRADGQRIDLSSRDSGLLLVATRQSWQPLSWSYRDLIGELRYAIRLLSRSVARVRFYPAEARPWPDDPAPLDGNEHGLDKQLAADAVHNFERLPMDSNPDGFTARLVENLSVAGEAWVHLDADDRFWVRSTSEISAAADGSVVLNTLPTSISGGRRLIDPSTEDLMRCWVPHPEWGHLADSAMRCLLDVAEDVVLAGREQRAAARSRVAANGILLMPDSLSLVRTRAEDDEDDDSVTSDTFMGDFTAAMLASIRDDGDAQAVVPIVIRGDAEDLDKVRHIILQRADSEQLVARQTAAILRLLKGLDVQPEQVEGVGATNHWNAWIIDSRSIRDQVQPMAETVASCLTQAFLRPALTSLDHSPADVARVVIAVDVSELAENPNRGQDARDAYDRTAISGAALREALGFEEKDAPDDDEALRRLAATGALPVAVTAALLGLSQQDLHQAAVIEGQITETTAGTPALPAAGKRPAAQPGQVTPERSVPAEPSSVTASGVDAALVDRITVAADAAIARVLERAGARVRSAAQKDRALVASLVGVEPCRIAAKLGREQVEALVPVADLLTDGYTRLRGQVAGWLAGTVPARETGAAWRELAAVIDTAAERALFAPELPGDMLIQPDEVRAALIASMNREI